ncbi:hypothetical protein FB451DRAFT_1193406 [Mycena latifolia]|nr:hypothetical protein FB451DRAFT_1193406 [Mycena latifolia]
MGVSVLSIQTETCCCASPGSGTDGSVDWAYYFEIVTAKWPGPRGPGPVKPGQGAGRVCRPRHRRRRSNTTSSIQRRAVEWLLLICIRRVYGKSTRDGHGLISDRRFDSAGISYFIGDSGLELWEFCSAEVMFAMDRHCLAISKDHINGPGKLQGIRTDTPLDQTVELFYNGEVQNEATAEFKIREAGTGSGLPTGDPAAGAGLEQVWKGIQTGCQQEMQLHLHLPHQTPDPPSGALARWGSYVKNNQVDGTKKKSSIILVAVTIYENVQMHEWSGRKRLDDVFDGSE